MALTQDEITRVRAAAGVSPLPSKSSNAVSLVTRLGLDNAPVAAPTSQGFKADVAQDMENRGQQIQQSYTRQLQGKQSSLGTVVDTAGAVAGGVFDIAVEGVKTANRALGGLPGKALTELPGPVHSAKEAVQTPQGQAMITKAQEAYEALKKAHPAGTQHAESVANLAMLLPVGLGAKVGSEVTGKALQVTGRGLQASAEASTGSAIKKFAASLVKPEETKAIRDLEVGRTTEKGVGPFKGSVVAPTPSEIRAAAAVEKIPGLNPRMTLQQNYNVIKEANIKEAQNLEAQVRANDFVIPKREVLSRMKAAHATLEHSPLIVGDAQKMAAKLLAGAEKIIQENAGTGSGLLKAKKDYDQWVLSQKPKAFDAKAENAFTIANREIRNTFKDILDESAPSAGVKASLAKQAALFDAMDNIAPKAAYEANSAFGRTLQRVAEILGVKNRAVQGVAALVGIGGLGAASFFAPIVAGVGVPAYLIYRGGKLILKPGLRNAIGKIIETAGNALNPADKQILRDAYHGRLESPETGMSSVSHPSGGAPTEGLPNGSKMANPTPASAVNTTQASKNVIPEQKFENYNPSGLRNPQINSPIPTTSNMNPIEPKSSTPKTVVKPPHTGESGFVRNPFFSENIRQKLASLEGKELSAYISKQFKVPGAMGDMLASLIKELKLTGNADFESLAKVLENNTKPL